jgi:hypothetical protein
VNDLGRWRTVLNPSELELFDRIAFSLWAYTDESPVGTPPTAATDLYYFQELIQELVSIEKNGGRIPQGHHPSGSRLCAIQRDMQTLAAQTTTSSSSTCSSIHGQHGGPSFDLGGAPEELPDDFADSPDLVGFIDTDFPITDFINMDLCDDFEKPPQESTPTPELWHRPWKDIPPTIILLLASIAFSIILAVAIGKPAVSLRLSNPLVFYFSCSRTLGPPSLENIVWY